MRSACLLLPWLLAGAVCIIWIQSSDRLQSGPGLALALCLLGAGLALAALRRAEEGQLHWDGQHWNWEAAGRHDLGSVRPRLDWQQGLLLEFHSAAGKRLWLWPERASAPLYWEGLRRAVYAPAAGAGRSAVAATDGAGP